MSNIIKLTALDGQEVAFDDEVIGSGAMKDVYFSPDHTYVVGFFRKPQDVRSRDRLQNIVGTYRKRIFEGEGGDSWNNLFCWPVRLVEWNGKLGVVCPTYQKYYFFSSGKFKGKEKEGKWFASAKLRNRFLEPEQKGTWLTHVSMCLQLSRAVRRLHAAGLAHSDLSYKNVLVDPQTGRATIIDCDGLVVPGKFPPDVVGTPDFIAPEVLQTRMMPVGDPKRVLPSIATDRHALAVLIYMYLLNRHPLRGSKIHDPQDSARDEELSMGANALFVEHPTDRSNRPKVKSLEKWELPQGDVDKRPYTLCGPYLSRLFERAFIDGLHHPEKRPTAEEWENALLRTLDLMQPCSNPRCDQRWFVFDNTTKPRCPFCGTTYTKPLPMLNFYYAPTGSKFLSEKYRLMVYDKQSLYMWHANRFMVRNERVPLDQRAPVGDFHFHNGQWILVNRRLQDMWDVTDPAAKCQIRPGECVPLTEGRRILFSKADGGRLAVVQLANI